MCPVTSVKFTAARTRGYPSVRWTTKVWKKRPRFATPATNHGSSSQHSLYPFEYYRHKRKRLIKHVKIPNFKSLDIFLGLLSILIMSTIGIIEEAEAPSSVRLPTNPFAQAPTFDYETILISFCVLSSIALLVSFLKRQTQRPSFTPLRHAW